MAPKKTSFYRGSYQPQFLFETGLQSASRLQGPARCNSYLSPCGSPGIQYYPKDPNLDRYVVYVSKGNF